MRLKTLLVLLALCVIAGVTAGCGTVKGSAQGVGCAVVSTAQGVNDDAQGFWKGTMIADDWIRRNLW